MYASLLSNVLHTMLKPPSDCQGCELCEWTGEVFIVISKCIWLKLRGFKDSSQRVGPSKIICVLFSLITLSFTPCLSFPLTAKGGISLNVQERYS